MHKFLAGVAALVLAGCASGHRTFYTDLSAGWTPHLVAPAQAPAMVPGSGNIDQDVAQMFTEGFVLVGQSTFNGPAEANTGALTQAVRVGAERVILYSAYTNTQSGAIPMTSTRAVTTYEHGTVNAGTASGSYSGTSTTYVPTTTYVPYSVDRFDQTALYFAPLGPACFGAYLVDPTDSERRALGTNSLHRVFAVRNGSPAYLADILPGDFVLSIDDAPLGRTLPWGASEMSGEVVRVGIARPAGNGKDVAYTRLQVQMTLGQCPVLTVPAASG